MINDLLDPTGQNLRVREDSQVCYLSFIGSPYLTVSIFFLRPFLKYPTYVLFENKKFVLMYFLKLFVSTFSLLLDSSFLCVIMLIFSGYIC